MTPVKRQIGLGVLASLLAATAPAAWASSHREAPGITKTPKVDATDFYMFKSYEAGRGDYVTFIANYQPVQAPYGGPNYFTMDADAIYEIHIDNDGDAIEDITYQFDFANTLSNDGKGITLQIGDETVAIPLRQAGAISAGDSSLLNETETYTLTQIDGDRRSGTRAPITQNGGGATFVKPVDNIGTKTLANYDAYANQYIYPIAIPNCGTGRVFVGQRKDAFAVNLGPIFDLVNFVPLEGSIDQDPANDDLADANVTSLAIEVPVECVIGNGNGVIGAWTTASLPQAQLEDPLPSYEHTSVYGGAYVQQSRLSNPLVNEVVIGLPDKDLFNAAEPTQDSALATYVTNPTLPALLEVLFGVSAPTNLPRTDLVTAFLTGFPGLNQQATVTASEMMRLNTAVAATPAASQSNFGVVGEDLAGFPNGRRPGDDVVDIALRVVMGALCHPVPLGAELGVEGAEEDTESDLINLGLCSEEDAPSGDLPYTDGAPVSAASVPAVFPYLASPLPGATSN
ncbi:DUF4331 domain-containing protein [Sulfitobacter sabulilitoris]|uniref:DUF4331 domain-containing protein n=1 Tax=Sulfitobacter sabulilitoris TaxID=2562655 RepID=A0A5S3PIJ3_9RHOB|nr:DUF4331 domain-containing protein [Sulfitobacter sabulilitoris]TMM51785.1 DUF4331 domain-containing protein [Sulfitobacter sabulilitoris]